MWSYIEELACPSPFPTNEETSVEAQTWILIRTITREIKLANVYENIVCDRSALDNDAYLYCKSGHIWLCTSG